MEYDLQEESDSEIFCAVCKEIIAERYSYTYCVTCSSTAHHSCLLKSESSLNFRLSYTCPRCKYRQSRMMRGLPVPEPIPGTTASLSENLHMEPPTRVSELGDLRCQNSLNFPIEDPGTPSTPTNEIVKQLLELGAIPTVLDYSLEMPIHKAIRAKNLDVVKTLISHSKAELNCGLYKQRTILHHAAQYGSLEIVKLLVKRGCAVNVKDCIQETPIFMAAIRGDVPIMKYLFKKGAQLNLEVSSGATHFDKRTLLHRTVWHGHMEATRWLLKNGLCPDCLSTYKCTPLHFAAENGDVEMANLLLSYGANLNTLCDANRTPLQVAKQYKQEEMVQFLLFPPERERTTRSNKFKCCWFF